MKDVFEMQAIAECGVRENVFFSCVLCSQELHPLIVSWGELHLEEGTVR